MEQKENESTLTETKKRETEGNKYRKTEQQILRKKDKEWK
jgi:hypothetical protein